MNSKAITLVAVIFGFLILLSNSLYVIKDSERGIKLQFKEVIDDDLQPGLGVKVPFLHEIRKFDARVIPLELVSEEYITAEKKRLVVDSYVMWRIHNVAKYFTSVSGSLATAQSRLTPGIIEGLRNQFGDRTVYQVVSGEREELVLELTEKLNELTKEEYGIEVVDIRIKKIELPPDVTLSVYERMRKEREKEANGHRSEGRKEAAGITANANKQARVLLAEAEKQSQIKKGQGDATATNIYANAFGKNQEFYNFVRSLNAYNQAFNDKRDVLLLSPENDFFDYLHSSAP